MMLLAVYEGQKLQESYSFCLDRLHEKHSNGQGGAIPVKYYLLSFTDSKKCSCFRAAVLYPTQ